MNGKEARLFTTQAMRNYIFSNQHQGEQPPGVNLIQRLQHQLQVVLQRQAQQRARQPVVLQVHQPVHPVVRARLQQVQARQQRWRRRLL